MAVFKWFTGVISNRIAATRQLNYSGLWGSSFFQSLSFLLPFLLAQLTIHWSKTLNLISISPAVQFNRWIRESISSMILKVLQQGSCFRRLALLVSFTCVFLPGIPSYPLSVFSWQLLHGGAANRSSGALQNLALLPPLILTLMYCAMQSQKCYIMVKESWEV